MDTVLDKVGQPITEGCIIAYGHALGRSAGLRIGKVLSINKRAKQFPSDADVSFTVWGIDDSNPSFYEVRLASRKGTLIYPDRIVVLDEAKLSRVHRVLLASVQSDSTPQSLGDLTERLRKTDA